MKNKKLLIGIGIIAGLAIVGIGIYKNRRQTADDNVVRIGVILPLTGPVGEDGRMALAALQLAEKSICESNPEIQCKFCYEDGKYDAKSTIACFNKLMLNRPDALMVLGDVPNYSLSSLISDSQIVDLALVTCDETLIGNNDWMFAGWFPFSSENAELCKFAVESLNVTKFGILSLRNNFGDEAVRTFSAAARQHNCEIVASESFEMDSPDVKSQVAKVLSRNPEAVYVAGFGQGYIVAFNELFASGFKGHLLSNTAISIDGNRLNIVNHAAGVYYVDVSFDQNSLDAVSFIEKFKAQTGKTPSSTFATIYAMGQHLASRAIRVKHEGGQLKESLSSGGEDNAIIGSFRHMENGQLDVVLKIHQLESDNE